MLLPVICPNCKKTYDYHLIQCCPYCGSPPRPHDCPKPLCLLDTSSGAFLACLNCPEKLPVTGVRIPRPGWGGMRRGAGAPSGNLNRLVTGGRSKLLQRGISKLAEDPEMRAVLLIIARLANEGTVPASTRKLILKITQPKRRTRKQIREVLNA